MFKTEHQLRVVQAPTCTDQCWPRFAELSQANQQQWIPMEGMGWRNFPVAHQLHRVEKPSWCTSASPFTGVAWLPILCNWLGQCGKKTSKKTGHITD